jgi:hypothetical protein
MSGADDEGEARRSARYPKRERVTLKWSSPPLRLPGEEEASEPARPESAEVELLELAGEDTVGRAPSPSPEEEQPGGDGWDRQRPTGPGSSRPRRESPPGGTRSEVDDAAVGGALSLVDQRSRPSSPTIDLAAEMCDRYALGDYTAALRAAELILGRQADHAEAQRVSEACRDRLVQLHGSRLGSLERIPVQAVEGAEVRWLGLDHRAAYLLSRVDGAHTLEEILDVSAMPRLEALKTLVELLDMGAIRLSP